MAPKATETFHVWDAQAARSRVFKEGDDVPDYIAANVGAHVLDGPVADQDDDADQGTGTPDDLGGNAPADPDAGTPPTGEDENKAEAFDPTADGVKAADVKAYLTGLDRDTDEGKAEFDRVTAAEKAGADRSSAYVD